MPNLILNLKDSRCENPTTAGNKGARLSWLLRKGYRVPPGFCVTCAATSVHQEELIKALITELPRVDPPWAVRSSSTVEDSGRHSFAGVFKTVLGVYDFKSLIEAISKVQESVHSESVTQYASAVGVDTDSIRMAVLVQEMLNATVSGVAFGCDPVTAEEVVIIEGNYGLGESVVDGSVTPDSAEVTPDGSVRRLRIGSKHSKVILTATGTERMETSESERSRSALSARLISKLAQLTRELSRDLGQPQDIEWAAIGEEVFVTQARPVTGIESATR